MSAALHVEDLHVGYGGGDIVSGLSFALGEGEILTVIGPNGAGKSTMVKAVAGLVRPSAGRISVEGAETAGLPAAEVARRGLAYVPQEANVFRSLTVMENLEMGAWLAPARLGEGRERVLALFPRLAERARVRAGRLSGGERQMAALAMALMLAPRVLVLDEPSAGLAPQMVGEMFETVAAVNATGVSILMVEQNAIRALEMSHRGLVLAGGRRRAEGPAQELLADPEIGELFLGRGAGTRA